MELHVEDLHVHYNNVAALKGVSLEINRGDFITLIGSNGAGKSTTLRTISGLEKPASGHIHFDGQPIEHLGADRIVRMGIAHVPEGRRIFKDLSVLENLALGAFTRSDKSEVQRNLRRMYEIFPRLEERKHQHARTLSGGEQQMVSIARALMSSPRVLLLDEPSLGLAPIVVQEIGRILTEINQTGVTILLVEQNADLALKLAQRGYVLETGSITLQDEADNLANNDHVRQAYLGV